MKIRPEKEAEILPFEQPKLKLAYSGPKDGGPDWLSGMECGTEFKCRDKTGRTPRWLVVEYTHMGKLKGDVLLCPTVRLNNPDSWFWVDPVAFCKEWEFRGVIEVPEGQTAEVDDDMGDIRGDT